MKDLIKKQSIMVREQTGMIKEKSTWPDKEKYQDDIEEGKVAPFYFLYGSESFYHVEIVQALNRKLITPNNRDFNLENFEARKTSAGDWVGAARTLSFMGGIKLIIV